MNPSPSAPTSVIVAGIIAILGSVLAFFISCIGFLGIFMLGRTENVPPPPPIVKTSGEVGLLIFLSCSVLGLCTGIGLLRLRNWARISALIWAGFSAFISAIVILFVLLMPIPDVPNGPPNMAAITHITRIVGLLLYAVPLLVGVWWLILFNQKTIAAQFTASLAAQIPTDPSGFPVSLSPAKPKCPLLITILAWFFIVSSCFSILFSFIYTKLPMLLFGHPIYGTPARAFFLVSCALVVVSGIGLLKAKPWAFWLTVAWQVFGLASGIVTILSPNFESAMQSMLSSMDLPASSTMPMQNYRFFSYFGLILPVVVLVALFYYRSHFLQKSERE